MNSPTKPNGHVTACNCEQCAKFYRTAMVRTHWWLEKAELRATRATARAASREATIRRLLEEIRELRDMRTCNG